MAMAEQKEFVDNVVSVNRVTKVTKGGKRFSFSAFVVSGDQKRTYWNWTWQEP